MMEENLDWLRIEAAAAPSKRKSGFVFDADCRRAIGAALVAYVDECAQQRQVGRCVVGDPAARAIDPLVARRIQHHVAALCRAARVPQDGRLAPEAMQVDIAALDRETSLLSETIGAAVASARVQSVTSPLEAFARLVARLAGVYVRAGGVAERGQGGRSDQDDEPEDGRDEGGGDGAERVAVKPDRQFIKFLRTLLLDAEEVLLGLPDEPALRRADGSFARRVRSALARRAAWGPRQ